jgi:hypothetical protein
MNATRSWLRYHQLDDAEVGVQHVGNHLIRYWQQCGIDPDDPTLTALTNALAHTCQPNPAPPADATAEHSPNPVLGQARMCP